MASVEELSRLLRGRAGFDVVDVQPSENQLRIVGRVPPNASSQWVLIVHRLLIAQEQLPWKVDVSRHYFLRQVGSNKKLFYSWRLIFQAPKVQQHLVSVMDVIHNAPRPARVELQEYPLTGAQRTHANGKGAYSAETSPLVASLATQMKMGGAR